MAGTPASWLTYFGDEPFSPEDRRVQLIEALCIFLLGEQGWPTLSKLKAGPLQQLVLAIDFSLLLQASGIRDLQSAMDMQPQECLGCLGSAVYEVCTVAVRLHLPGASPSRCMVAKFAETSHVCMVCSAITQGHARGLHGPESSNFHVGQHEI